MIYSVGVGDGVMQRTRTSAAVTLFSQNIPAKDQEERKRGLTLNNTLWNLFPVPLTELNKFSGNHFPRKIKEIKNLE